VVRELHIEQRTTSYYQRHHLIERKYKIWSSPGVNHCFSGGFCTFINDIADDMLGLCRLFADDTSGGERALEINNLRSMVNIDLNNITHWAKQWLVKLNRKKTK
jgi:hypothetical protein